MAKVGSGAAFRDAFRPEIFPVFLMYFLWGFGTGGLWLVRPLFAFQTGGGSFILVAVISSISALPRMVTSPLTGWLTDRYGRKIFVIIGAFLHIVAMCSDFFITTYLPFFLLEILGGIGISVWMTSSNVLMADNTRVETRGRAMAVREMSSRIGLLIGPAVAGVIGDVFELRYVFFFIAATKLAVILVTWLWIRESRKPVERPARKLRFSLPRPDMTMFRTRAFLALSVATIAISMVGGGTGVFRTLFPPQAESVAGLNTAQVGLLLAIASGFALGSTLPTGIASDRYGRRVVVLAGLLVTALSAALMANIVTFVGAAVAVVAFGLAEAAGWGTLQVYAMDQAPPDNRGSFLGIWSLFQNAGQVSGPLIIGVLADTFGFGVGFMVVTGLLIAGAIIMYAFGRETRVRQATSEEPSLP